MKNLKGVLTFIRLLFDNPQMADPSNYYSKEHAKIAGGLKKLHWTDEDYETERKLYWTASLYLNDKGEIAAPGKWLRKSLILAGNPGGKKSNPYKLGLYVKDYYKLHFADDKKTVSEMYETDKYCYTRLVQSGTKVQILKTSAVFSNCSIDFDVEYDQSIINGDDIKNKLIYAGQAKGMGGFRPVYGLFTVKF